MDIITSLNSFSSVAAGERANVKLRSGAGLAYARIVLDTNGTITDPALIKRVQLNLNTQTLIDITGAEMVMRRKYFGQPDNSADGFFELDLRAPTGAYRSRQGRDGTSLVTENGDVISLEVDIDAAATNPVLRGYAVQYIASQRNPRGGSVPIKRTQVLRIFRQSFQAAATGEVQNYSMPLGPGIQRLHIGGGDGAIDHLEIERNTQSIHDAPKAISDLILEEAGRVPQDGYLHYDPTAEGWNMQDIVFTNAQSFIAKMNATTAGSIPFLYETVEDVA